MVYTHHVTQIRGSRSFGGAHAHTSCAHVVVCQPLQAAFQHNVIPYCAYKRVNVYKRVDGCVEQHTNAWTDVWSSIKTRGWICGPVCRVIETHRWGCIRVVIRVIGENVGHRFTGHRCERGIFTVAGIEHHTQAAATTDKSMIHRHQLLLTRAWHTDSRLFWQRHSLLY